MSTRTVAPARPRCNGLRSPLATATQSPLPPISPPTGTGLAPSQPAAADPRSLTLAEFGDYLRTINNRDGRPYDDTTINASVFPAKALDAWMTANSLDGDFTTVDTSMLNRYFREYYQAHGQGGTHTQQRNLIQLFNFLQREYGHPSPYTAGLNRYAEVRGRPKTLSPAFVNDLLEVTGGGKARDFETARDHAIIRILRSEGIRRQELLGMVMHTLPADLLKNPVVRLVPLKGARNAGEGRLVSLAPATARALAVYLRARRRHKLAGSEWVWLGTRNRGRLGNTGIRKILVRRAAEAGYAQVTPHQFRHTFSDGFRLRPLRRRDPPTARHLGFLHVDTAVTLPIGFEAYAAFALRAWLTRNSAVSDRTRRFARWSAIAALVLGMAGQVAYHLLTQAGVSRAPWEVTTAVSCLPVAVLGMGSALAHLLRSDASSADTAALVEHEDVGGPTREHASPPEYILSARPPARMRPSEACTAAARVIASGQRVLRRSLRSAGLHGSNADLGMLARLVRVSPHSDSARAAPSHAPP